MLRDRLREIDAHLHRWAPTFWRFVKYRFRQGDAFGLGFTLAFLFVVLAMWLFLEIRADVAGRVGLFAFDARMEPALQELRTPGLTRAVIFLTNLGGTVGITVWVLALGTLLLVRRRWWDLVGLLFVSAGGGLVLRGLKFLFQRARPLERLVEVGGYSFPSGHAFGSTVFFGYVIYVAWKDVHSPARRTAITLFALFMIVAIPLSRVYLNVHWFTDVVGGVLAGSAWLVAGILVFRFIEHHPARRKGLQQTSGDGVGREQ